MNEKCTGAVEALSGVLKIIDETATRRTIDGVKRDVTDLRNDLLKGVARDFEQRVKLS